MKYLRLNKCLSDVNEGESLRFKKFVFNGGEHHIKLECGDLGNEDVIIEWSGYKASDIMLLLLSVDALRRLNARHISLVMPYVPFARQDRVMVNGEPLSIRVLADVVNSQYFESVYTLDNHSPVSTALIDNCVEIDTKNILMNYLNSDGLLVSPDAGAAKKSHDIARDFGMEIVQCLKIRDVKTGEITGTSADTRDIKGLDCYVVDDICDGGRTFIEIAKLLKKLNCGNLHLYVSHGIFSQGEKELLKYYSEICCTTTKRSLIDIPNVNIIPIRKEDLK